MGYFQELKDQVVLVTGGSKGIGKDIAITFAKLGSHVIITGRNEADLNETLSQLAFVGFYNRSVYSASKSGAVQLTKALAVEWAPYNVKVNAVAPTFIQTELTSQFLQDPDFKHDVLSRIPLGELAQVSDVTGAVLFLASDLARFITGETIKVDGGWTAI